MIEILDKQADFYVINKPAGYSCQNELEQPGVLQQFSEQVQESLYLVHRLDKVTSGIMLFARHREAAQQFQTLFATQQIHKTYIALLSKRPHKKQGTVIGDQIKSRQGRWKLQRTTIKPAITTFISFGCDLIAPYRVAVVKPKTGKTHQIRVAMKSQGAAIVGDPLYGQSQNKKDRTYLHAYELNFIWQQAPYCINLIPDFGELFIKISHWLPNELNQLNKR